MMDDRSLVSTRCIYPAPAGYHNLSFLSNTRTGRRHAARPSNLGSLYHPDLRRLLILTVQLHYKFRQVGLSLGHLGPHPRPGILGDAMLLCNGLWRARLKLVVRPPCGMQPSHTMLRGSL